MSSKSGMIRDRATLYCFVAEKSFRGGFRAAGGFGCCCAAGAAGEGVASPVYLISEVMGFVTLLFFAQISYSTFRTFVIYPLFGSF